MVTVSPEDVQAAEADLITLLTNELIRARAEARAWRGVGERLMAEANGHKPKRKAKP